MLYQFWIVFAALLLAIILLDKKYCMLRDISQAPGHIPYSWARVQLAWWTIIILSSFIFIILAKGSAPTLNNSCVILLGISAATTATARVIDLSDQEKLYERHQDQFGKNFIIDILSDQTGPSVHRFQTVVFNAVFGIWFINQVLTSTSLDANQIMPVIKDNNLILLGLSSATYAAMKVTENKSKELEATANTSNTTEASNIEPDGSVG